MPTTRYRPVQLLLTAAVLAVAWANSPWQDGYHDLWTTDLSPEVGGWHLALTARDWVNDGLMAIFFLVIALEIKREFVQGELRDRRRAALPVVAALGGMVIPAGFYLAFNGTGAAADGWGIPMATDIAFALGVLALLAPNMPSGARVFLLTLAIVDDIGAIAVIALFYSESLDVGPLLVAGAIVVVLYALARRGVTSLLPFAMLGVALWLALHEAGIHATLAGVALGLLAPRVEWLEHRLEPWSAWVIVPVFALANAGVTLTGSSLADALTSSVSLGVVVGLVVGKILGISGAAWAACRLRVAELPAGVGWRQLVGVSALGGIGFTVSLFVTALAFGEGRLASEAKVGVFVASLLASAIAAIALRRERA